MHIDDLYRVLRNAHFQAQGVIDTLLDPLILLDGDLCVIDASAAFYETFQVGRDETIGRPLYELGNGQWNLPELRDLLERIISKSASVIDYEVRGEFPGIGWRTMLVTARRLVHPDRNSRVILLSIIDATQRRLKEDETNILVGELRHRIKNILGVVMSLARQTQAADRHAEDYKEDFLGRLDALIRANGFVAESREPGKLSSLVRATLEPYGAWPDRVEIAHAPEVLLNQDQVLPVSLILHEVATNAVKYGALSEPTGRLQIGWSLDGPKEDQGLLCFTWREMDGPLVSAPATQGFGTRLIDFSTVRDLGGSVKRSYEPEGLYMELRFPL